MSEDKGRHGDSDDFAGLSRTGAALLAALLVTAVFLRHPVQTLKELLPVVRRLGLQALKLPLVPFVLVAAMLWSRRKNRRPTFEDHLRGFGDETDHP